MPNILQRAHSAQLMQLSRTSIYLELLHSI